MAASSIPSGGDIRIEFKTKEGVYVNLKPYRYSKSRGLPLLGKELSQTKASIVSVKDMGGLSEWILFNSGREFYCYPFYATEKPSDLNHPVDKHSYKSSYPLSHDVNQCTRSADNLDIVIGFNDGPIQRINPISKSTIAVYNNDRQMDPTDVICIKWVPGSETQFVSAHMSGNMLVWSIEEQYKQSNSNIPTQTVHKKLKDTTIYICKPKNKFALLYRWSIGHGAITALEFSPDTNHIAIASQDGFLRIYDFHKMELYGRMRSYFGGLLCVCWSPDGKYVVTGGEDDLISVWSFDDKRIVTRGEGHQSYVNSVSFDPYTSDNSLQKYTLSDSTELTTVSSTELKSQRSSRFLEEDQSYRVGSVGQDGLLCLWELSTDNLCLPRRGWNRVSRVMSKQSSSLQNEDDVESTQTPVAAADETLTNNKEDENEVKSKQKTRKNSENNELVNPIETEATSFDSPSKGKKKKKDKQQHSSKSIAKSAVVRKVKNFVYGAETTNAHRHISTFESCHSDDIAPRMTDVNIIEPLVAKKIYPERLTDIIFREDCLLIATEDGYIQLWSRPGYESELEVNYGINSPKQREPKHTSV